MIYASELATQALNLEPVGTPHEGPQCVCSMCQRQILPGALSTLKKLPGTFLDFGHLAPSDYLCGFCAAAATQSVMRELQRSVITAKGIYNLNTDDSRAWFWLTPPEPPYAVVINHSTMAAFHYFWRTPVTLDNEFVQFNLDDVVYQVRRSRIRKALEYAKVIVDKAPSLPKRKTVLKSPFVVLARDPSKKATMSNGHLSRDTLELAGLYPECKEAADYLQSLTPGELVALSPMLKQNPATPVRPELIQRIATK